ncbi:tetratricopeptide repeat-containing sensor histidine kinase [Mucilaginibacter flavidus]|uniref:tetratricopeptide repeat-containing sensor histidine kinase n=1 Tax=Mucilaginibacter flavidus TaxID=2949309 RepID=UPI002091F327|nr:sensor histidine kinase [Mucilaginibacter flavidus]MCO5946342.1 sensor histidine kinase [Mucilaginibacter flavidus]
MKKLIMLLWLLPSIAPAQNKITDSLLKLLPAAKTDTQRVNIYNKLSERFMNSHTDRGLTYANQALNLSQKVKYLKGEADAYYNRGQILVNILKSDSAKVDYEKAIAIYKKINDREGLAEIYSDYGILLRVQGRGSDAIVYFQQSADLYEKVDNLGGSAETLVLLANNYNQLHLFNKALAMYQKTYQLRLKINDKLAAAQSLAGIGLTYRNKQIYEPGTKNFEQAVQYMLKARTAFIKADHKLYIAFIDKEIGITYLQQNESKQALVYFLEAEDWFKKLDTKREMGSLYKGIGNAYLKLKQYRQAKIYLEKGLDAALAEKYQQHIMESYEGLYNYYKQTGDDKASLKYHEKWMDAKDTLTQKANFEKITEVTAKYETEKKEQQIKLLNKENTIQKLSITSRNKTIGIIAGLFLLSCIVAALFYNRQKLKQRANQQALMLKQQDILTKAIVDAEENERKRIASDLHDGVGQLFSAVKMNLSGLFERITIAREEDRFLAENTLALVDESCKEVRTISHQMMPNMLLRSGIASDLKSFIEKIDSDSLKVTLEATGFKNKLESNVETMLYRIIQESINNVIKHAKATRLDLVLNRDSKGITTKITDNGIGFDTGEAGSSTGIGLKNIATRVEYLKGTIRYITAPGEGTVVIIEVPVS